MELILHGTIYMVLSFRVKQSNTKLHDLGTCKFFLEEKLMFGRRDLYFQALEKYHHLAFIGILLSSMFALSPCSNKHTY